MGLERGSREDRGDRGDERVGDGVNYYIRSLYQDQIPSNDELLIDIPFALQGLKTTTLKWNVVKEEGGMEDISLEVPSTIPFPLIGLSYKLLEPAVLYKQLKVLIERKNDEDGGSSSRPSLIRQSLKSAIDNELNGYLSLVGIIENEARKSMNGSSLTLRKCHILLQEATLGLRLLHSIAQESESLIGGQILSLLYKHSYNGDEFISKFSKKILGTVSKPFYEILNQWINSGRLMDPYEEFFVKIGDDSSIWNNRFILDAGLIPKFMTNKVAHQVFEIGKTLYFIRVACNDNEWIDNKQTANNINDYTNLENQIFKGYDEVVEYLNQILKSKFHLNLHLQGLKDYLLLSKGDFVQLLVEEAAPTLDQPASSLLRHHLTSMLETAIRSSNAQFDSPEVLKSIDARMLELGHGDIGWEVFTLEYRVEQPLDIIILDKRSSREYLRVFNFLWRIKWASFSIYYVWKLLAITHRGGIIGAASNNSNNNNNNNKQAWTTVRNTSQEMMHFINELQYYINYEVVEMAWSELQKELLKGGGRLTVDETIEAHRKYLQQITYKGLLGGGSLIGELHEIIKDILSFRSLVEGMHKLTTPATTEEPARFETLYKGIKTLRHNFGFNVEQLVHKLKQEENSEMRFLAVRLDFNHFYTNQRHKRNN